MAKFYSGKKGKSGSKKPSQLTKLNCVRYSEKEIESLILKLFKAGNTQSKIGLMLRDSYGVPSVSLITNKKITKILKDNKLLPELPEDLTSLIKRQIKIMEHLENNKKDETAKRGLMLTESKVRRLVNYYKMKGRLSKDWKYNREQAKLLVG